MFLDRYLLFGKGFFQFIGPSAGDALRGQAHGFGFDENARLHDFLDGQLAGHEQIGIHIRQPVEAQLLYVGAAVGTLADGHKTV